MKKAPSLQLGSFESIDFLCPEVQKKGKVKEGHCLFVVGLFMIYSVATYSERYYLCSTAIGDGFQQQFIALSIINIHVNFPFALRQSS